jgi:hypothetical protein
MRLVARAPAAQVVRADVHARRRLTRSTPLALGTRVARMAEPRIHGRFSTASITI